MISAFGVDHGDISKAQAKDHAVEGAAAIGGAAAGQGVYQGAGYGAKHVNLKRNWEKPPGAKHHRPKGMSNGQYDKAIKATGAPKGSVEAMRRMPSSIPGSTYMRVLGHTHRGKLGTAIGTGATLAGSAAAFHAARKREKS